MDLGHDGILASLGAFFIGAWGYIVRRQNNRTDKAYELLEKKLDKEDARYLITDKIDPIQEDIREMKQDIKDIKNSVK
jgi:hypothetical protein